MHDIVVPLDGTPQSEAALPWAQAIAERAGGHLHLVHVHIPFQVPTCNEVLGERVGQTLRQIADATQERESEYLRETRSRLRIGEPAPEVSTALVQGPLRAALLGHAGDAGATLIVMATRPLRGLRRVWSGSVTDELVRRCPVPVLVILAREGPLPEPRVDRVMVPLDGTIAAEGVVAHAVAMARLFGAGLLFVRVVGPDRDSKAAERYLASVEQRVQPSGIPAETRMAVGQDVAETLVRTATEAQASVVALSSHYRRGLSRLIFGNVAEALVLDGSCPVLVLAGPARRAAGSRSNRTASWS